MEPWTQYQSILQLAAGTNIAITGLLSVYGSEFGREERRISALEQSISSLGSKLSENVNEDKALKSKLNNLIDRAKKLKKGTTSEEMKSQPLVFWGTIICLVASIASVALLFISSLKPDVESNMALIVSIVLACPPFVIVFMAASKYIFVTRNLHLDRERLQNDLFVEAGAWLAARTAGGANGSEQ